MAATVLWARSSPEWQRIWKGLPLLQALILKMIKKNGYPVYASLEECKEEADVVVDFASPKAADHLMDFCAEKKLGLVLCTTRAF